MVEMNTKELDKIIVGRVEPHIYAFTTNTVPNYLKVGDTYRPVSVRLKEWEHHFPNLQKQFEHIAKTNNGKYYRDFAIHYYLETILGLQRLQPNTIPSLPYYSKEFFQNATINDIQQAIQDIEKVSKQNNLSTYNFYTDDRLPIITAFKRTENYKPRPNQEDTIKAFKQAIKEGRSNLLMYAVMRFGKSFTSMCCACAMKAEKVLVVSAKADVKEEWQRTVESHKMFKDYAFIDASVLTHHKNVINTILQGKKADKKKIKDNYEKCSRVAIFLTLQDLQGSDIKERHKELFEKGIDLLIVDETHFGARAEEYGKVLKLNKKELKNELKDLEDTLDDLDKGIKVIQRKITLHLSGTPYRILMGSEFGEGDIIAFYQFTDIIDDKEKWDKDNLFKDDVKEWDNPYYGFPEMVRFAFNLNDSSRRLIDDLRQKGFSSSLNDLFKPKSITKDIAGNFKKFVHENEVLDLLKVIDGSKSEKNILSFLNYGKLKNGKMCRHIVCVLPYRASCDAFEELMKTNGGQFVNLKDYEIINISGVGFKQQKISDIKNRITNFEEDGKKTISLTVNKMLTGTTVKEWDTMLFFKEVSSPQEYDQAIFRLQNQYVKQIKDPNSADCIKYNMKPQTLLVDFDPVRMFVMQEQKSKIYNVNTKSNGNSELHKRIERELQISPIIVANNGKLEKVTANNIMDEIRKYSASKTIMDEATSIPIDATLLQEDEIAKLLKNLSPINSKNGIAMKPNSGAGTTIALPDENSEGNNGTSTDGDDANGDIQSQHSNLDDLKKRLATFYAHILFFAMLTNNKVCSLEDVIGTIKKNNEDKRIANNIGLADNDLSLIKKYINPFHLSDLDYKIHNINDFINDKSINASERVEKALTKFGRFSDSEIVTSSNVADEMVSLLPDYKDNKPKILDIASKQGEFTCALHKRYGKKVDIYALPTSPIAYEFTHKVYQLLELDCNNIYKDFNTYDLIGTDKEKYFKILDDMKFNAIVGNPPYQEVIDTKRSLAKQYFPSFIKIGINLKPSYLSLITPTKWFTADGQDNSFPKLREFVKKNNHFTQIDSYKGKELFSSIELSTVCSFLWKNNYLGDVEFIEHFGKIDKVKRPLFESGLDIILPVNKQVSIVRKVISHKDFKSLNTISTGRAPFGIVGKDFNKISDTNCSPGFISVQCAYEEIRYCDDKYVTKNREILNAYKIFTSKGNGGAGLLTDGKPVAILGKTFVAGPNMACTDSLISFGRFGNEIEATNLKKYFETKFLRFMVGILKISQNLYQNVYQFVPCQEFSSKSVIDWTKSVRDIDQKLYTIYKFDEEEKEYIESMIKSM